jgi:hypothetical protein
MNKLIWTLQIVAALAFGASGGMKIVTAPADLRANPAMGWATDFSDGAIRAIGAAEVAGAVGLIVPAATGIAPMLTPAAGVGLALLMAGAANTHLQRNEPAVPATVLGALALIAGLLRAKRMRASPRGRQ